MEELEQPVVEIEEGIVVEVRGLVAERFDEALEREPFLVVLVAAGRAGAHREQVATFGEEHEKQPVKKDEARIVKRAAFQMLVADAVGSVIGEAAREFFEHVENAAAEIFFEFRLGKEGLLLDLIERAPAIRAAHECARREEREE